jgi:hypothetical protein
MFFSEKKDLVDALGTQFPFEFSLKPVVEVFSNEIGNSLQTPLLRNFIGLNSISNLTANNLLSPVSITGHFTVFGFTSLPLFLTLTSVGSHPSVSLFANNGYNPAVVDGAIYTSAGIVATAGNYVYLGLVTSTNNISHYCFVVPSGMTFSCSSMPAFQQQGLYTFSKPIGSVNQPIAYNLSFNHRNLYGEISSSSVSGANLFFSRPYAKRDQNTQVLHTSSNLPITLLFSSMCFNVTSLHNTLNFSGYEIVPAITQNTVIPLTTFTTLP